VSFEIFNSWYKDVKSIQIENLKKQENGYYTFNVILEEKNVDEVTHYEARILADDSKIIESSAKQIKSPAAGWLTFNQNNFSMKYPDHLDASSIWSKNENRIYAFEINTDACSIKLKFGKPIGIPFMSSPEEFKEMVQTIRYK
jgi:hypothetical protein